MRTIIKKNLLLTILLTLFFFVGCTEEDIYKGQEYSGSTFDLPIGFSKSLSGSEIKTYRILVFSDGDLVSNTELINTQDDSPTTKVRVAKGINNFYVFCNETAELKTKINKITAESDLEKITFASPVATTNTDVPMYGKVSNALIEVYNGGVNVTVEGITKTHLTVNVDRLMAKVSLTFIKNIAQADDDFVIDQMKVNIHRMPKITSIKQDQPYTSSEWMSHLTLTGLGTITNNGEYTITNGRYSLADGIDNIKFRDIYIPEHILADPTDKEQACYIAVDVTYHMKNGDGTQFRTTYLIDLGQEPSSNYNLRRNNHIDIYATIRKLGENIIAVVNLVPWNDGGTIDVEEPEGMYYLNLSAAVARYPYTLYLNKDRQVFIKDENGNYIAPLSYDYSCLFWTNRPSSKVSTSNFIMDQDPSKIIGITQNMTITEDNTVGQTHNVKGKIDIHIPSEDIVAGFGQSYSMRLKTDILDRKLTFSAIDYDFIPELIDPGFTQLKDIVITGHNTSSAKSTTETFEISVCLPKGCDLSYLLMPTGRVSITFSDITPVGTDEFAPRLYKATYTSSSPRYVTLGNYKITFLINQGSATINTSSFTLDFTIRK